jgi:hypothetical protein
MSARNRTQKYTGIAFRTRRQIFRATGDSHGQFHHYASKSPGWSPGDFCGLAQEPLDRPIICAVRFGSPLFLVEWLRLQNLQRARAVNPPVVAAPAAPSAIVTRQT